MNFYHENDPRIKDMLVHRWPFCYMHGAAEDVINIEQYERDISWSAPDLFVCNEPMPSEAGAYYGKLYGHDVVMVIAEHLGTLGGRGAINEPSTDDYVHVFKPEDWQ